MTIQSGIPVARIELLDALQVRAVNLYSKLALRETPMLFLEFHGTEASVAEQSERFGEIATEFGGGPFEWTTRPEERTRLWEARHNAALSTCTLRPGRAHDPTDVCVPISRLAECVTETQRDIAESKLIAPIVGHVGDGNFHLTLLIDRDDPDEVARRQGVQRAAGGARARHGRHLHRRARRRPGQDEISPDRARRAGARCDARHQARARPADIMNPGKIF